MSVILNVINSFLDRDLCASDDCIQPGDGTGTVEEGQSVPLFDYAIGEYNIE